MNGLVFMLRVEGAMNLSDSRFTVAKEMSISLTLDALLKEKNENIIVNGELLVVDMTGFSAKHVARMTFDNNKDYYKIQQVIQLTICRVIIVMAVFLNKQR